jgi:hypothetical protein
MNRYIIGGISIAILLFLASILTMQNKPLKPTYTITPTTACVKADNMRVAVCATTIVKTGW